jgi:hypothetical protein
LLRYDLALLSYFEWMQSLKKKYPKALADGVGKVNLSFDFCPIK